MLDLIAVGDVMLDVLGPAGGGTPFHAPLRVVVGGSAVNVAQQAVRTGRSAAVVGRVGPDVAGRMVTESIREAGIEPRLAVDDHASTGCVASLGGLIVADRGANGRLRPADVAGIDARVVVVSGYLLLHEDSQPAALAALAAAAAAGALTCVDLAAARLVDRADDLDRLLADAAVVIGDAAAVEAAGGLEHLAQGRRAAAATLGAEGALGAAGADRGRAEPPFRLAQNPWGAGDAFVAAFAFALADAATLGDALVAACAAGSALGRRIGTTSTAWRHKL